jgi:hypothetical protein
MRIILVFIALFSLTNSSAQSIQKTKQSIDVQVNTIDHGIKTRQYSFTKKEDKKLLHYTYHINSGNVVMISRSFGENNDSVKQAFYYNKDKLIYSTESIISYYITDNVTDSIGWGGNYYFSNNKLIDLVTLGHGKSEEDSWNPEKEVLLNSNHARKDVMKTASKRQRE